MRNQKNTISNELNFEVIYQDCFSFLGFVRFDGYFYNVAVLATEFLDLEVKAIFFKDIYSVFICSFPVAISYYCVIKYSEI